MKETIVVNKMVEGKFGPQALVGKKYYSFGKFFKGDKNLPLNTPLDIDVYVTEKGNSYINNLLAAPVIANDDGEVEDVKPVAKAKFVPKAKATDSTMSKEEWAAKDQRISRQGVIQAAVQAVASHVSNTEELYLQAEELALKMLAFVNK